MVYVQHKLNRVKQILASIMSVEGDPAFTRNCEVQGGRIKSSRYNAVTELNLFDHEFSIFRLPYTCRASLEAFHVQAIIARLV